VSAKMVGHVVSAGGRAFASSRARASDRVS
jgi:hypothetical protein